ncbi:type VI-D CRISPR-associated RNA-guided ribonuclease Cas13d [bacterium]|nr:type VI-D CRISPR-associated RNA-guided ribonuclease Cas13d [bacterium]
MANQPENKKEQEKRKVKLPQAKAAGLKSTFLVNGEVVMTTFGNGNEAILEKKIDKKNTVTDIAKPANISVKPEPEKKKIRIKSSRVDVDAVADRPADNQGMDLLRAKSELEREYFGRTFTDNVHIQIIYNIIDIYKILAEYSTNIVYQLDNMSREEGDERDYVGNFSAGMSYKNWKIAGNKEKDRDFLSRFIKKPQLKYYGNVFDQGGEEKVYDVLALLGLVRQLSVHGSMMLNGESRDSWMFDLIQLKSFDETFLTVLNEEYEKGVDSINRSFKKNSLVNLEILQKMFPGEPAERLVEKYYDFSIRKSYKNFGFSIRKLREQMLTIEDGCIASLVSPTRDTMRSKIVNLFDYTLISFYENAPAKIKEMANKLRGVAKDEDAKEAIYRDEAKTVWPQVANAINRMNSYMNEGFIKNLRFGNRKTPPHDLTNAMNRASNLIRAEQIVDDTPHVNALLFSRLVFLLTKFLDGKEINVLLTTLIHSFDNLSSLLSVLRNLGLQTEFVPEYRMFADSAVVCQKLKEINCFSRMQKALGNAKRVMYEEALVLLGFDGSKEELTAAVDKMLCLEVDENGQKKKKPKGTGDTGLRNFIASNVIESSRFQYLIRYCNPRKIRELSENRALIEFQLKRLPETQIDRYYESCHGPKEVILDKKVAYLADLILKMNYLEVKDARPITNKLTPKEKENSQKMQGIISLYLTMLYLLVKGLVNVNSRYVIAFAARQRDDLLLQDYIDGKAGLLSLTRYYCNPAGFEARGTTCPINKRARNYLMHDAEMVNDDMLSQFRNKVAHLNVIQSFNKYANEIKRADSYFGLYHFAVQRLLSDEDVRAKQTPEAQAWSAIVKQTGTYCKDYVKALCTPFGYNLARFKNLSIEALFDKNELKETKEQGEIGETNG